jgi:hypothetical protein
MGLQYATDLQQRKIEVSDRVLGCCSWCYALAQFFWAANTYYPLALAAKMPDISGVGSLVETLDMLHVFVRNSTY